MGPVDLVVLGRCEKLVPIALFEHAVVRGGREDAEAELTIQSTPLQPKKKLSNKDPKPAFASNPKA